MKISVKMVKRLLIVTVLVVFCCVLANNKAWRDGNWLKLPQRHQTEKKLSPKLQEVADRYEAYVSAAMGAENVPGAAVAIIKDSTIILLKGFGVKRAGSLDSVDIHTIFRLASLSKGFAPILAAQLIQEGCLNLDDKVVSYMPYLALKTPELTQGITIRHVLSHTTGLPRHTYSNLLNSGLYYEQIFMKLKNVRPIHAPGTVYDYQNVIYSFIGDVVHAATGKSYTRLLNERIFNPAGMSDASATFNGAIEANNIAAPHWYFKNKGYAPIDISRNYYEVIPAAGVNASIYDMANWLQVLLGNRPNVATEEQLDLVFKPQIGVSTREMRDWNGQLSQAWYALGWRVLHVGDRNVVYHGGFVNGFRAEIAFDRKEKIGIVVLSNAVSSFIGDSMPRFFDIYDQVTKPSLFSAAR